MSTFSVVGLDEHEAALRAALFEAANTEGAAYIFFREARIGSDPWERQRHTKLLIREVIPIIPVSAGAGHVTWDTASYVALLQRAKQEELILGIAHSHPGGPNRFSEQDDVNEAELFRTMCHRNGPKSKFVSVLFAGDDKVLARVWQHPKHQTDVRMITFIGERIQVHRPGTASLGAPAFARQALAFGPELTSQLKSLRFGVIGAGGTGSATAPLLARAGAGQIVIIDDDIVETTNLNRLHGATQSDADAMRPKAEVVAAEIARMGLGTRVIPMRGWVSDPAVRDALKSCDVIFCCTDDHAGRVFLNRLAYFYLTVVFDMGLAMAVAPPPPPGEQHGRYLSTRNNFNAAGGLSALPGRSRSRDRARRGFASERSR